MPLLSNDPIKLGLSQPSSMGAPQSLDDDPFDDDQEKILGGLGLTPEQMIGVSKLFGASKTSPNKDIRDKLIEEYTNNRNLTPKDRVAKVAYANGDLSGNPHDGTFAPKTQGAKFDGAQSDEERRASGANRTGRDLSRGQDPLRGNRLQSSMSDTLQKQWEERRAPLQKQREERRAPLQKLADARLNNPFRKEFGITTKIETPDGRVLAEREEAVGVARGGTAGAVGSSADKIGQMELTSDGRRAIANRLSVATTTPEKLGFQSTNPSPEDKKKFEEEWKKNNPTLPVPGADRPTNEVRVVTGRFGTAVGGAPSIKDQLVSQGKLPRDFELTPEQRTGQAPLPKEYAAMKQELLTNAANVARNEGTVSDPGTRAVMRGVGPQGVAAIDTATAKAVANQKMIRESKANEAALRSIYSPAQMNDLYKTIAKANKTGGEVYPKGDGTFGIREKVDPFLEAPAYIKAQLAKSPQKQDAFDKAVDKMWKGRRAANKKG